MGSQDPSSMEAQAVASDTELSASSVPTGSSDELPTWKKHMVVFVVSWMGLMATFSSTSLLTAIPEIAEEFSTTTVILNITNAAVLIAMGISSLIWSPLSEIFGRRLIYNVAIFVIMAPSIGVALAPNMAVFTAMRLICGFTGTFFMVAGQIIITDIFEPAVRGRATACLMIGTVAGPALGTKLFPPFLVISSISELAISRALHDPVVALDFANMTEHSRTLCRRNHCHV